MAKKLTDGLRGRDVIARFGGDEFAVLLRGIGADDAQVVLSREAETSSTATWSIGVAQWQPGQTLDAVLGDADLRLYAAEQAGSGSRAAWLAAVEPPPRM